MSDDRDAQPFREISRLDEISGDYEAVLCDVWGVLHNGRAAFPAASDALVAYRRRGGIVVLLTNAPRPAPPICEQVLRLGVSPDAFDAVMTSGEVTIRQIAERIDQPVWHVGPSRDHGLYDAAAALAGRAPRRVELDEAAYVLCTGLFDDTSETSADYEPMLRKMAARRLPMVCANPDIIIHRGADVVYCAGALARRYEELGGSAIYAGKPYAPVYAEALAAAERARGAPLARARLLAIGDGMQTDIAGAKGAGLDALFVTRGIHLHALHPTGAEEKADAGELARLFAHHRVWPTATISELRG